MPYRDPVGIALARKFRWDYKICRDCGASHLSIRAKKCRKCHSKNLRMKTRNYPRK